ALLMSPYLYYLVRDLRMASPYSTSALSTDLLNFVIPTRTIGIGCAVGFFSNLARGFTGNITERTGYVGLPLLIVALYYVVERGVTLEARLIAVMLVATAVFAMGPRLHIAGRAYFKLPWSVFHRTPLLDQVLPARFTAYLFLTLAVATAEWLSI